MATDLHVPLVCMICYIAMIAGFHIGRQGGGWKTTDPEIWALSFGTIALSSFILSAIWNLGVRVI